MLAFIDHFLDRITMYRLLWWYLRILIAAAVVLGFFHLIPYSPIAILISTFLLVSICLITNKIFATVFAAPTNKESAYITALILALIVSPLQQFDIKSLLFYVWVGVWSMAVKYLFAINKKHLFNPAAIAVVLTAYGIEQSASWWVGNAFMMPFIVIGGILIVRKIRRWDMVFSFFLVSALTIFTGAVIKGTNIFTVSNQMLLHSSLFFFAFVMLTEPLTTPPTRTLQMIYGGLVGFLFAPDIHVAGIYSTPELALVVGNIFSYLVSPKQKLLLHLQKKIELAPGIMEFLFRPEKQLAFRPGQYFEWTLPHDKSDTRGNRRYFTLASSPTEDIVRLGVKFYEKRSSFKQKMAAMNDRDIIVAGQLAGDFTLPDDLKQKCVFIAGGIGITPFRSMIKYLLDTKQTRQVILLYANKTENEIVYRDVFDQAEKLLGIKTVYVLTGTHAVGQDWQGRVGRITAQMIREEVPDYMERIFYLSGPPTMVDAYDKTLREMGVAARQIKTDFFPGLA